MRLAPISFGKEYKTREIAEIVGGRQASGEIISEISGIPQHKMLTTYSTDIYEACSHYIGTKIIEQYPDFASVRDMSNKIRSTMSLPLNKDSSKRIEELFAQKQDIINGVCAKYGETVDVKPFKIDILY